MSFDKSLFGKLDENESNPLKDGVVDNTVVRVEEDEKELTLFQEKIKFVLNTGKSALSDEDREYLTNLYNNGGEDE